ncbi:hypothetical protein [Neisseria lactamica]|uniref:hypothetical protein n=1 Tax=Neisseria lactamica TaxID=486 RepID=UPI00069FC91F|nr:hypothetical protein [Neisseria lactamica]
MRNRDNFTQATIDKLSRQAGNFCSNPDCRIMVMSAKAQGGNGITNLGVAAHICAAAPGGPRYNEDMTPAERKDHSNGIWLCQNCAHLIDSEPHNYSVALLHEWKVDAQKFAREKLGTKPFNTPVTHMLPEQIYRKNDIEFIQNYLDFAPFTRIPYFLSRMPETLYLDFFDIGEYWYHAHIDMPHLCDLKDRKLNELFQDFFDKYNLLYNLINGYYEESTYSIPHFTSPITTRSPHLIYLNNKLPRNLHEDLRINIGNNTNIFMNIYREVIDYLRTNYPEIILEGRNSLPSKS